MQNCKTGNKKVIQARPESLAIKKQLVFTYNVFAVVVTTVRTNSVRKLRLMTLRTN